MVRETRHKRLYLEVRTNINRLYRSTIYAMRRFLNTEIRAEPEKDDLTGIYYNAM